jgi:hypothetical protein
MRTLLALAAPVFLACAVADTTRRLFAPDPAWSAGGDAVCVSCRARGTQPHALILTVEER